MVRARLSSHVSFGFCVFFRGDDGNEAFEDSRPDTDEVTTKKFSVCVDLLRRVWWQWPLLWCCVSEETGSGILLVDYFLLARDEGRRLVFGQ